MFTQLLNRFNHAGASTPTRLSELPPQDCALVAGGMMKLPFENHSADNLLTTADGDPVVVYVDGVCINSVSDGFVHL
jgi:hypothetical protein